MEYFKIADITVKVVWEDEEERNKVYNLLGVSFHPAFLGAYELSEQEVGKAEQFDLEATVRKTTQGTIPLQCKVIEKQYYYKENNLFCLTMVHENQTPYLSIKVKDDFKRVDLIPHEPYRCAESMQLLVAVFEQMLPLKNGLMIHGSGMEYQGKGIIFSGFSGSGKTTQARLWRKYRDVIIINGDSPIIRNTPTGPYMYGSPWCGTSGESINRKVPLKAIVLVNQSKKNHVEELTGDDAVLAVYTNILYFSQDEQDLDLLLPVLEKIVRNIKVYKLYCNMEEDAVDTLEQYLREDRV